MNWQRLSNQPEPPLNSVAEAARTHGLTVAEVEDWQEKFLVGAENALRTRPKDEDVLMRQSIWLWIMGLCWVVVILAAGVLPLSNFVGHSHWNSIIWYPSSDLLNEPRRLLRIIADVVANILLFMPLGWIWGEHFSLKGQRSRVVVVVVGLLLSIGIELYQVYCHNRFPSLLDLAANTCGTYWGAQFGSYNRHMTEWLRSKFYVLPGPASTNKRPHT